MAHLSSTTTRFFYYWIYGLIISLHWVPAYSQPVAFRELEDQVYRLNNEAKYGQAQALLLPLLDNPTYSPDEQFQATVLLSYTYKRLLDYTTALSWLEKAQHLARQTTRPDSNRTQIQAQLALAYFDIHRYAKSDSLMQALAQNQFRYVDRENRAKLVHQQGYLLFLAKRYADAEVLYDRAMIDLQASSPCDMPMILVKKMQLYAAMNQMERVATTLQRTCQYADSCGIIKYKIYAYDELKAIYKARHDLAGMGQATSVLDSLNIAYAQAEHMAELHNQHQTLDRQKQERALATEQQWLTCALWGAGLLGLLAVGLLIALRLRQARQVRLERELDQMRAELTAILKPTPQPQPLHTALISPPPADTRVVGRSVLPPTYPMSLQQPDLSLLSDRQRDVLDGIIAGLSNRDIADKLFVSENTVKYHLKNIYVLLNVKDRVELLVNLTAKQGNFS